MSSEFVAVDGAVELYGEIPVRTWRWLGVNETYVNTAAKRHRRAENVNVAAGDYRLAFVVLERTSVDEINIRIAAGAVMDIVKLQNVPDDGQHAGHIKIHVARGARVNYTEFILGAARANSKLDIYLDGDEARADVTAAYFAAGSQIVDLNYVIHQIGKRTDATMNVYGALSGQADKIFRGTLDFQKGSGGSIGRETESVVMLDDGVRNRSVPIMLSGEDDVDGHHAASIGRLDEEKLFYLLSRGLDEAAARRLMLDAAFAPALDRVPAGEQRERVAEAVADKIKRGLGEVE